MKTIKLIILLLFITSVCCSQESSDDSYVSLFVKTEPTAKSNGKIAFNVGFGTEYVMKSMYIQVQFFTIPKLNNVGYSEITAGAGLNQRLGTFKDLRIKEGFMVGYNFRDGETYPIYSFELGVEYFLSKRISLGVVGYVTKRGDSDFYDCKHYVFSTDGRISIILDRVK